jgi:hypothetical protein
VKRYRAGSEKQPFPLQRPALTIRQSTAKPFAVDCGECWRLLIVPEVGKASLSATYVADAKHPERWRLWDVTHHRIERPAAIHGVEGVEVLADEWERSTGWVPDVPTRSFLRLTPTHLQWLGELSTRCACHGPEFQVLHTFLDPEGEDWPDPQKLGRLEDSQSSRHIKDVGRYVQQADGTYKQKTGCDYQGTKGLGAGIYRVRLGGQAFTCLRVMEIDGDMPDVLDVAFITRQGRTVLHRRYEENHCLPGQADMRGCDTWTEAYPDNDRIVLDGRTFVVWYERIAAFAFGLDPT